MAEPTTLYKNGYEMSVTAPSEARRLLAEGWSLTDDYVPFAFHDDNLEFGTVDTDAPMPVPQMNVAPVKRGRPRKVKNV
jgi:hypothetical protein